MRAAIERAIPWDELPTVTSSKLFATIKSYLLEVKSTGRLLAPVGQLFDDFARRYPELIEEDNDLRADFDVCVGRLENRDLIRRLSFGDYVLLQPELLDAYASAMVIAAKDEPDGLGSLAEETALNGHFYVPDDQRIGDRSRSSCCCMRRSRSSFAMIWRCGKARRMAAIWSFPPSSIATTPKRPIRPEKLWP